MQPQDDDPIKTDLIPMLRAWAAQKKRAMTGKTVLPGGAVHEDGWPSTSSTLLPFMGGASGNPPSIHTQKFAEVYSGIGLAMWRILCSSPGAIREIIHAHYILKGAAKKKARRLEISTTMYWDRLKEAHYYLLGRTADISRSRRRKVSGQVKSYRKRVEA